MKIAFLNPQGNFNPGDSYWAEHPDFGGQLVYVKEVAIALSQLGHQVDILTRQIIDADWPQFSKPLDFYPGVTGVRIVRIPCGPPRFLPKEELWPSLISEWVPNILRFYQQEDEMPDVFTAHYADGGLAAAEIKKFSGIPFTFTGHSLGAQKMDMLGVSETNLVEFIRFNFPLRLEAERTAMRMADRIITSTIIEATEQYSHIYYSEHVQIPNDKFSIIPPGVNTRIFSETQSNLDAAIKKRIVSILETIPQNRRELPTIISASRLDPKKNLAGLVNTYLSSECLMQSSNLLFAVRGKPEGFDQKIFWQTENNSVVKDLGKLRRENGLEDKMIAVPVNSQEELAAAYRWGASQKSVFVLPAIYEPFGLAQLEAMSCGLPAATTKNGGPSESMIENGEEFGVLFDPADPADFSSGLLRMLNSKDEWKQLKQAGLQRVHSKYTWEKSAKSYIEVINDIIIC